MRKIAGKSKLRVALLQTHSSPLAEENIKTLTGMIRAAKKSGAEFVLTPEYCLHWGNHAHYARQTQKIPGDESRIFQNLARDLKIFLLMGSLFEKIPGKDKPANTSLLISPSGKILAKYRKLHLFDFNPDGGNSFMESQMISKGSKIVRAKTPFGNIGLSICYDLRFPELYRKLSSMHCGMLCVPSAFFHETGKAHWEPLLRARAIENQSFVLAPNQCGVVKNGTRAWGHSMAVDPWGNIIAEAPENKECVLLAELTFEELEKARIRIPALKNRRRDLFG